MNVTYYRGQAIGDENLTIVFIRGLHMYMYMNSGIWMHHHPILDMDSYKLWKSYGYEFTKITEEEVFLELL